MIHGQQEQSHNAAKDRDAEVLLAKKQLFVRSRMLCNLRERHSDLIRRLEDAYKACGIQMTGIGAVKSTAAASTETIPDIDVDILISRIHELSSKSKNSQHIETILQKSRERVIALSEELEKTKTESKSRPRRSENSETTASDSDVSVSGSVASLPSMSSNDQINKLECEKWKIINILSKEIDRSRELEYKLLKSDRLNDVHRGLLVDYQSENEKLIADHAEMDAMFDGLDDTKTLIDYKRTEMQRMTREIVAKCEQLKVTRVEAERLRTALEDVSGLEHQLSRLEAVTRDLTLHQSNLKEKLLKQEEERQIRIDEEEVIRRQHQLKFDELMEAHRRVRGDADKPAKSNRKIRNILKRFSSRLKR